MTLALGLAIPLVALYALFLVWYGGNGRPMRPDESEHFMHALGSHTQDEAVVQELIKVIASDDGNEFVMQNLARFRPKALYPPGYRFNDDPRAADRRSGSFIEPEGADVWHCVAMVRYRRRRDFLRFALATQRNDIFVHAFIGLFHDSGVGHGPFLPY